MAKRRPTQQPAKRVPLIRWGTQKQAKLNERERVHLNRIHDLETSLRGANAVIDNLIQARDGLVRVLDTWLSPKNVAALRKVCMTPLRTSVEIGIDEPLGVLCVWLAAMEHRGKGEIAAAIMKAAQDTVDTGKSVLGTRPDPAFPSSVSGITNVSPDHDDPDSINDLFAKGVDVHLERLDKDYYWLGITPIGGETVHVDIYGKAKRGRSDLRARIRK